MVRVVAVAAAFLTLTLALMPFQWVAVALRLPIRRSIPVMYHRLLCALLGVRITDRGGAADARPLLIVSNHVSWLDIPVVTARAPVVFVAKREVSTWPFFGLLARLQRSVFVDRTKRQTTGVTNAEIAARLAEGDPVVLFAEGTSSDGNRVLPFRSGLVGAAQHSLAMAAQTGTVWIQPLSIAYVGLEGLPLTRAQRPVLAWYGDLELLPHLAGVMRRSAIEVVLTWGTPIPCTADADRKAIAQMAERQVRGATAEVLRGAWRQSH